MFIFSVELILATQLRFVLILFLSCNSSLQINIIHVHVQQRHKVLDTRNTAAKMSDICCVYTARYQLLR